MVDILELKQYLANERQLNAKLLKEIEKLHDERERDIAQMALMTAGVKKYQQRILELEAIVNDTRGNISNASR